jgi:hypothetical protein
MNIHETVLHPILQSRFWEALSAFSALANIGFVVYYVWVLYLRRLKFELYIDNWAEVRNRCCDPTCENPHLDFKCTLVAVGPKERVAALTLQKTEIRCPSGLKVEVTPNNHRTPTGEYWGHHTPLVLCGGEKISFTVSYKPELEKLKQGEYKISVRLKSRDGQIVESSTETMAVSDQRVKEMADLPCHIPVKIEFIEHGRIQK